MTAIGRNTFEGYALVVTARAMLFQSHYWTCPEWLPFSQITVERDYDGPEIVVRVSPWLSGVKNLKEMEDLQDCIDAEAEAAKEAQNGEGN